jgi:hypothetical protein
MSKGALTNLSLARKLSLNLAGRAFVPSISVAFSSRSLPLIASGPNGPFSLEDKPGEAPLGIEFRYTFPSLFRTLGTPLVARSR